MSRCPTCAYPMHDSTFFPPHRCPPAWLVWEEGDDPVNAMTVYEPEPNAAAEAYLAAMHNGSGVYEQEQRVVFVQLRTGGDEELAPIRYRVRMSLMPTYEAWQETAAAIARRDGASS